jgi:hypothetical protein
MRQRLEFHADHERFFREQLEALASLHLTWGCVFGVLTEPPPNRSFDRVVEVFCRQLEWPPLSGPDLARACARLHFAVWLCHKLPWESTDEPVDGERYLRMMLIERYWLYRHQWIAEAWAGMG